MNDILRLGLIGCGEIAWKTAAAFIEEGISTLAAVMDINADLAGEVAERLNVPFVTTDSDALLARDDVDAVYIATPHFTHLPLALAAAQAGKPIMLEKPAGINYEQALEIVDACEKAGVFLSVAFPMRYFGGFGYARDLIHGGALGEIFGFHLSMRSFKPLSYWGGGYTLRAPSRWRTQLEKAGGGVLLMNGSHSVDVMYWMTGLEPVRVYAEFGTFNTPDIQVEDLAAVTIRCENGAIGSIEAGSAVPGGIPEAESRDEGIYGTRGQIRLPTFWSDAPLRVYLEEPYGEMEAGVWHDFPMERPDMRALMARDFVRAVRAGGPMPIPGRETLKTFWTIHGAYRAGREGVPIIRP